MKALRSRSEIERAPIDTVIRAGEAKARSVMISISSSAVNRLSNTLLIARFFPRRTIFMKLKSRPEDFQVEEIPLVEPGSDGRFVFYRLSKQGIGTLEAIDSVRRQFDVSASRVAHGGIER